MKHRALLLCLGVLASGCHSDARSPLDPSARPAGAATVESPAAVREIRVGEDVSGTLVLHGTQHVYEFTAPTTGTLIARLRWPVANGRLELWLAEELASQTEQSPIVSSLPVVGGRKYRVRIADDSAWDYDDFVTPYVLTTSMK